MFEQLKIHNFRGISSGRLSDLGKVNLLVGPNNSGKTALLEMLYLTAVSGRPCSLELTSTNKILSARVPLEKDFLGQKPSPRLWRRHGEPEKWKSPPGSVSDAKALYYHLSSEENHFLNDFRLIPPPSGQIGFGGFTKEDLSTLSLFTLEKSKEIPFELVEPYLGSDLEIEEHLISYLWYPPFVWRQKGLAVWALKGKEPDPAQILFFDFLTAHEHFQQEFFDFAYHNVADWEEKISASMAKIFPEMAGAQVDLKSNREIKGAVTGYVKFPRQLPIPIDAFGDGARHAFKALAALLALTELTGDDHTALFLWEDPELFMHPGALHRLLEEVMHLLSRKPVQVFIATQSMEVIASVDEILKKQNGNFIKPEDFRLYRLYLENGILKSSTFYERNLQAWLKSSKDPRFWESPDLPFIYLHLGEDEK